MSEEKINQPELEDVIKLSWFSIEPGNYIYTSVKEIVFPEKHLMIINDGREITIVTLEENLPLLVSYISNKEQWRLLNIKCGNPFYCTGFIAFISSALAEEGIDIVITSSFSNDLIMVMEKDLENATAILLRIGFSKN